MMNDKIFSIGISCIGSGVGQSVISSLRLSRLPIRTIGLGCNPFAYGAYDCATHDCTPSIYDANYFDRLFEICLRHRIDLLIPGLDDELVILAKNIKTLNEAGIKVVISGENLISICRDKERMGDELGQYADVFVKTYDKNKLRESNGNNSVHFPLIAKPRGGFASRGVQIIQNNEDLLKLPDNYIIQELAKPGEQDPNYHVFFDNLKNGRNAQVAEISIQVVYNQSGNLLGRMMSYNKLQNGIPIEIVPFESNYVWSVIDKLIPALLERGLAGPLNIQGRLTNEGLKLYEMNPRFTGITGLRALMGFNEVEACVKEWLGIDTAGNHLQMNYNYFGSRQTADKKIPFERDLSITRLFNTLNVTRSGQTKTLLITGSCGFLGQSLLKCLESEPGFKIWAFDLDKEKTKQLYNNKVEAVYDYSDYLNGKIHLGNVDILIHLGFTRAHGTFQEIAGSLNFTNEIFTRAVSNFVPAIINISSQSVYGTSTRPPWSECTPVAPNSSYAQAKYATELLLGSLNTINNTLRYSSIRLGALAGVSGGMTSNDFLSKFVSHAIKGEQITLTGGMQKMERFDVRDAAEAIVEMIKTNPDTWKPVYNLSSGNVLSLKTIAEKVIETTARISGKGKSGIIVDGTEVKLEFGMESSLFYDDMDWRPKYHIDDTIESLVKCLMETC
jgi:nucleoside-diphosphate-sugar epimerase